MKTKKLPKLIVIIGPTASGKTDLSVEIAKKVKGEIVSADSRQIYKYLDVGSGKVTKKEMRGVVHYCLDIFPPGKTKSITDYLKYANKAIKEIIAKGKTPIICGGTGFYIDGILYGIPKNAKPNQKLRKNLEKETLENLLKKIKVLNKKKYLELINNENTSERNNKRRLVRIIEILESKKEESNVVEISKLNKKIKYDVEYVFIDISKEKLRERINLRLKRRLETKGKNNLINEVKFLRDKLKIKDQWLLSLGLEYKYVTMYLRGDMNYQEMKEILGNKIWQFAKRQITWNKRYRK
ncbi:MAG: tRNA dimethylallyltransferase [Patescibacteria group bacterium]|nr:tRNA dimethylallyltransferase [Patescibacteria group bacterium]